jgi:hypothetical protein
MDDQFIVIALIGINDTDRPFGCRVIGEHAPHPGNYMRVFGPDTRAECEAWRSENCVGAAGADEDDDAGGEGAG